MEFKQRLEAAAATLVAYEKLVALYEEKNIPLESGVSNAEQEDAVSWNS